MPARGRRSAKPFTRRRSAAAFRLRPPVPRMNLSPNRGREDGAAVRPGPPGVVRLRPLLAGRQVLPGYGYGCPFRRSVAHPAFRSPFRRHGLPTPFRRRPFIGVLLSAAFYRRPFAEGLFRRPVLWVRCRFFVPGGTARTSSFSSLSPLRSDPSPLRPLSAPTPLRSVPSPLCPLSSLSPLRSVPSRLCPLSALSPLRSVPSRLCPLSSLPPLRSVPSPLCPLSAPSPLRSVSSPLRPVPVPFLSPSPLLAGRRFVAFFRSEG